jgi:hypothetical protein
MLCVRQSHRCDDNGRAGFEHVKPHCATGQGVILHRLLMKLTSRLLGRPLISLAAGTQ